MAHLREETAGADPWGVECGVSQREVHDVAEGMLAASYVSALEVGCATGVFTARLMPRAGRLRVVDVLPEAIERCRRRCGAGPVYTVGGIQDWGEEYDLVVAMDVLCYVARLDLPAAIALLVRQLKPGGDLLFSCQGDRVLREWGLVGAEEIQLLMEACLQIGSCQWVGDTVVARYVKA